MRNFIKLASAGILGVSTLAFLPGCSTEPPTEAGKQNLKEDSGSTLDQLTRLDSSLDSFLSGAYAYVIFPEVGKGGLGVGASYGRGTVVEQGKHVGYADITQGTIGLQAGAQTFTEVIAFQNKEALDRLKNNTFSLTANASAVALKAGAGASAKYDNGVAVFTKPNGGLMFEATVGGQQFSYKAASDSTNEPMQPTDNQSNKQPANP